MAMTVVLPLVNTIPIICPYYCFILLSNCAELAKGSKSFRCNGICKEKNQLMFLTEGQFSILFYYILALLSCHNTCVVVKYVVCTSTI